LSGDTAFKVNWKDRPRGASFGAGAWAQNVALAPHDSSGLRDPVATFGLPYVYFTSVILRGDSTLKGASQML